MNLFRERLQRYKNPPSYNQIRQYISKFEGFQKIQADSVIEVDEFDALITHSSISDMDNANNDDHAAANLMFFYIIWLYRWI